jgi:hypothetical protein
LVRKGQSFSSKGNTYIIYGSGPYLGLPTVGKAGAVSMGGI